MKPHALHPIMRRFQQAMLNVAHRTGNKKLAQQAVALGTQAPPQLGSEAPQQLGTNAAPTLGTQAPQPLGTGQQ